MAGVTPNIRLNLPTYDEVGWDAKMNANFIMMDSLISRVSAIGGTYVGLYANFTTYSANQVVTDPSDSSLWQCLVPYTSSATGTFVQERVAYPSNWNNVTVVTASAASSATLAAGSATSSNTANGLANAAAAAAAASAVSAGISASAAQAGSGLNNTGRNLLHNATFRITQRGVGPFTTTSGYGVDRWKMQAFTDLHSITVAALSDADRTAIGDEEAVLCLTDVFTSAGGATSSSQLFQPIEGVRRLGSKTVAVSFYAKAVAAISLGVRMVQFFGTGGSPSASVATAAQTVSITTAWQRFTLTFTLPSVLGKTFGTNSDTSVGLYFSLSCGATYAADLGVGVQSGTLSLWGVQVEIGALATQLEKAGLQEDLANCQRFYQAMPYTLTGYNTIGATNASDVPFAMQMRAVPTVVNTIVTQTNASSPIANALANASTLQIGYTSTATGASAYGGSVTLSAELS